MSMQPRRRSHHYRTRFVHMNTGEAANLVWTKATQLTARIQYAGEFNPSIIETDGEASNPGPRLRRRGPRSQAASALRLDRRSGRSADASSEEMLEERQLWQDMKFRVLHVNIRGWISHAAELVARLRRLTKKPDLICVNETFLNRTVEHLTLECYSLVARLDRNNGRLGHGAKTL